MALQEGEDYYSVLGVPRSATDEAISHAYRQQALQCHPDKHRGSLDAEERFKQLSKAYQVLSHPERRALYDQQLAGISDGRTSKDGTPIVWTKKYGWSSFNISFGWIGEPDMPEVPAAAATKAEPATSSEARPRRSGCFITDSMPATAMPACSSSSSLSSPIGQPHPAMHSSGAGSGAGAATSPRVEECIGLPVQKATCGSGTSPGPLSNPFNNFSKVFGLDDGLGRFVQSLRVSSCGGDEDSRPHPPWEERLTFNTDENAKMVPPQVGGSSRSQPVETF